MGYRVECEGGRVARGAAAFKIWAGARCTPQQAGLWNAPSRRHRVDIAKYVPRRGRVAPITEGLRVNKALHGREFPKGFAPAAPGCSPIPQTSRAQCSKKRDDGALALVQCAGDLCVIVFALHAPHQWSTNAIARPECHLGSRQGLGPGTPVVPLPSPRAQGRSAVEIFSSAWPGIESPYSLGGDLMLTPPHNRP